jgi:ribosomal protein L24E
VTTENTKTEVGVRGGGKVLAMKSDELSRLVMGKKNPGDIKWHGRGDAENKIAETRNTVNNGWRISRRKRIDSVRIIG